jgi:aspartyl-tRNA(Asn)/glutamyl-tRNA(Gln) amidotransferase subunit C
MKITADLVREICDLAKLDLDAGERDRMLRDLDQILEYVDQLSELDTSEVEPTISVLGHVAPMRGDRVADVLSAEEAVRNAPERSETAMVVPQVKEE